jgi:iron complex transport system substrate-binding protein
VRIASLVPSATEMLFALGLGESVVAVTHECDFPPEAAERAHLTRSVIPEDLPAAAIDAAVRERTEAGQALYELDEEVLAELEPDLIVTQALCEVCAVSFDDVRAVADRLPSRPSVISLDPRTLGEVLGDVRTLAQATDAKDAGVDLVRDAADRIDRVKLAVRGADRPRVAALEWLDPPFVGGHWVPQMIDLAGGEDLLGLPGERSRTATWDEIRASEPEVVVSMPCGYYADRCASEALAHRGEIESLGARTVVAVDAAAYFSRPGPRLVDGLEQLGHVLHPDRVDPPAAGRIVPVA